VGSNFPTSLDPVTLPDFDEALGQPARPASAFLTDVVDAVKAAQSTIGTGAAASGLMRVGAAVTVAQLPAGSTLTVLKSGGVWPARPTDRADIVVQWKGADPSPSIVSSGTGGMRDGIDIRLVTP
jgi:hypothetical protein